MRNSPWKLLTEHPPALIRLFARRRAENGVTVVMTMQEISISSGIPIARCREISGRVDWSDVTVEEAQRFIAGCGWDPLNYKDRNRKNAYTRSCQTAKRKYHYLKSSPLWATELAPLITLLRSKKSV
jgi:hypothetical protein